jgi:hypothetical protein
MKSEFDPQHRDGNVDYYLAKLAELTKKFSTFIPAAEQTTLLEGDCVSRRMIRRLSH